jgi:predicted nucleic acid-binding protein
LRCAPSASGVIVVDASAALELLLGAPAASAVEWRLFGANETLHAPHLIDVEVAHALRRYALAGDMSAERGRAAPEDLADLSLRRSPHEVLLPRVWELRANLTAYDAINVALAEALDAPLFTRDRRLPGAAGHRARVEEA